MLRRCLCSKTCICCRKAAARADLALIWAKTALVTMQAAEVVLRVKEVLGH